MKETDEEQYLTDLRNKCLEEMYSMFRRFKIEDERYSELAFKVEQAFDELIAESKKRKSQ